MKISKLAFATAVFCALGAQGAWAEGLRQPFAVTPVAYDYNAAEPKPAAPASPSDKPAAPQVQMPVAPEACAEEEEADECPKWELFGTTCSGWHVAGWLQAGFMAHEYGQDVPYGGPLAPNDRYEAMLNQGYIYAEKTVKTDECCWDIGGRVDYLFGTDFIYTMSTGLELHDDGTPHLNAGQTYYGSALPQAYLQIGGNDWDIKIGHFYTVHGYEVMTPTGNFFYSHSYEVRYAEPTTHTGVMAMKKMSDTLTVGAGLVNGWDAFDREDDELALMTGFTYTPCHEQYTLAWWVITGDEVALTGDNANRSLSTIVLNYKINDCWNYVVQQDTGWQRDGAYADLDPNGAIEDAEWYGVNQYLFRTLNDCWKVGGRLDVFRDDDGTRVSGVRATNPYPIPGGSAGTFYALTLGANWTPHSNFTVRPELRYDWFDGIGTLPFNNNTETDQLSASVDVIFTF